MKKEKKVGQGGNVLRISNITSFPSIIGSNVRLWIQDPLGA